MKAFVLLHHLLTTRPGIMQYNSSSIEITVSTTVGTSFSYIFQDSVQLITYSFSSGNYMFSRIEKTVNLEWDNSGAVRLETGCKKVEKDAAILTTFLSVTTY